mmetsp:Transcript_603/g.1688  ORF Transcript_603/g.1688 Transcript_603/m.1688 type:complete len:236 (-) Transcript_603:379-1086(-)
MISRYSRSLNWFTITPVARMAFFTSLMSHTWLSMSADGRSVSIARFTEKRSVSIPFTTGDMNRRMSALRWWSPRPPPSQDSHSGLLMLVHGFTTSAAWKMTNAHRRCSPTSVCRTNSDAASNMASATRRSRHRMPWSHTTSAVPNRSLATTPSSVCVPWCVACTTGRLAGTGTASGRRKCVKKASPECRSANEGRSASIMLPSSCSRVTISAHSIDQRSNTSGCPHVCSHPKYWK